MWCTLRFLVFIIFPQPQHSLYRWRNSAKKSVGGDTTEALYNSTRIVPSESIPNDQPNRWINPACNDPPLPLTLPQTVSARLSFLKPKPCIQKISSSLFHAGTFTFKCSSESRVVTRPSGNPLSFKSGKAFNLSRPKQKSGRPPDQPPPMALWLNSDWFLFFVKPSRLSRGSSQLEPKVLRKQTRLDFPQTFCENWNPI